MQTTEPDRRPALRDPDRRQEASRGAGLRPVLAVVLFIGLGSCGCNGLIRALFYPPQMNMQGLGPDTPGATFDHQDFGALLSRHVDESGMVAYGRLKQDEQLLDRYIQRLGEVDLSRLTRYEQLALLVNAYNAFTLKLMLENPGVESIKDLSKPWDTQRWKVGGRTVTLNHLEHGWIRPEFREPAIHFALVCAARSCPRLMRSAYTGAGLQDQFAGQIRWFLSKPDRFAWDPADRLFSISQLIDWYKQDFTSHSGSVPAYFAPYLPPAVAAQVRASKDEIRLRYLDYSWKLNGSW